MNDFDFLAGTWSVANRWRTDFLDDSSEWEEFPGVSEAARHFDGTARIDEITFPTKGFAGLTLRLYHPATRHWSCTGPDLDHRLADGPHQADLTAAIDNRYLWIGDS